MKYWQKDIDLGYNIKNWSINYDLNLDVDFKNGGFCKIYWVMKEYIDWSGLL